MAGMGQSLSLHMIYLDVATRLNDLLDSGTRLQKATRLVATPAIITSCFELRIWAEDIGVQEEDTESLTLDQIEASDPDLAQKVRSRLLAVRATIDAFESDSDRIMKGSVHSENTEDLVTYSTRILDAVHLLNKLSDDIREQKEKQGEMDLASAVRLALQQRAHPLGEKEMESKGLEVVDVDDESLEYSDEESGLIERLSRPVKRHGRSEISKEEPLIEEDPLTGRQFRAVSAPRAKLELRSSISLPRFRFPPVSKNQTRLATLYPGPLEEEIVCSIQTVGLNELKNREYESISYAYPSGNYKWNEIKVRSEDLIKGLLMLQHAIQALRRIRRIDVPIVIWIDYLCTDLGSDEEKGRQSQTYATVFAHARRVNLWVGEENARTRETFSWVKQLVKFELPDDLVLSSASASKWEEFLNFMQIRFQRRWVVQEIIFAQNLVILCGSEKLHWGDLAEGVMHWQKAKSRNHSLASHLYRKALNTHNTLILERQQTFAERLIHLAQHLAEKRTAAEDITLDELIISFSWTDNSTAKDAIYAFLGLAQGRTKDLLLAWHGSPTAVAPLVNYNLSDKTVFMRFVAHCIKVSGSLDIICRSWAPENAARLPTWIRKLQNGTYRSPLVDLVGKPGQVRRLYNASAGTYPSYRFGNAINLQSAARKTLTMWQLGRALLIEKLSDLDRISCLHSLFVEGIPCGSITKTSPRISQGVVTRECLELGGLDFSSHKGRWEADEIPSKLWRTLVADRTAEGNTPPSWYPRAIAGCLNNNTEGDLVTGINRHGDDTPATLSEVLSRIRDVTWNRKLLRTKDGLLALAPANAAAGDEVYVLLGCSVPVLLRKSVCGESFRLIGECFVMGLMNGEAMERLGTTEFGEGSQIMLV